LSKLFLPEKELFKDGRYLRPFSRIVSYSHDYSEQNNSVHHRKKCNTLGGAQRRDAGETRASLVSGRIIVASCHYFTIRLKEEALGQLTKKGDRSPRERERERERGEGGERRKEWKEKKGKEKVYENNLRASKNRNGNQRIKMET